MKPSRLERPRKGSWTRVFIYLIMLIIVLLMMFKSDFLVRLLFFR
jgi:hypothetical protein